MEGRSDKESKTPKFRRTVQRLPRNMDVLTNPASVAEARAVEQPHNSGPNKHERFEVGAPPRIWKPDAPEACQMPSGALGLLAARCLRSARDRKR